MNCAMSPFVSARAVSEARAFAAALRVGCLTTSSGGRDHGVTALAEGEGGG
jgi:hypothetical protein